MAVAMFTRWMGQVALRTMNRREGGEGFDPVAQYVMVDGRIGSNQAKTLR